MTVPDLRAIAAQLASGQSLEDAVRAVAPPGRTELLKRCAAVHHFDAALLDVLRAIPPAVDGVALPDLIALGAVEPVPGRPDRFRVPDLERRELYAGWWEGPDAGAIVPDGLRELSERVLAHLEAGSGGVVEALYHELVVAPGAALERFAAEFRAADADYDLARCQDLLDVVIERLALLGPEGAAVCNAHQRRLRSRAMWMRDWRRSSRFQLPAPSAVATEALLAGDVRVLELWADGGMGKSTYLRWLIARRCVPEGIACARVDLEAVNPLRACREPWLLLLELAEQLDRQLPDAPFFELLSQHPGQRERLLRRPTSAPSLGAAAADVKARFAATLRELDAGPIVIALDTLEAALPIAGTGAELAPLFELLESLLETVPALRIVLTSRARPGFPGARALRLEPFTDAEARTYLATKRGLEASPLTHRIVASAGGVPFKLELLADVAEERPGIDPDELVTTTGADMVYLMERILRPLDPDLAALLLYGVAPRVLEHDFAVAVIGPQLPGRDIDALWRALRRYASRASWVQLDPVDVHTVRFHPSILVPMRKLLEAADACPALHERAAAWFDARAVQEPANATRWLCEAVFHRFQLHPERASADWRACVDAARVDRRPDRRRALAAEVLGEDYAQRRSSRVDLRARWELAVAAVQLAHREAPDRRAGHGFEAERALGDLRHLQARSNGAPKLRRSELALVEAGVALVRGDAVAARPHVETALRGKLAREDQLWLRLAYAGALSAYDGRHAAAHFRASLAFARRGAPCDVAAVHLQLAVHHDALDRLDRALAACAEGARLATGRQAVELALTRARLELRRGAPSLALAVLDDVDREEPDVQARCAILRVQALLAAGHPLEARALADDTAEWFSGSLLGAGDRQWAIAAEGRELRGKVHAELLDAQLALADFEEAADRWSRIGATAAVCRCRVRGAALQLRGLGDLAEAAARLESARRTRLERGGDVWTRRLLLGAELLARRGRRDRAARLVGEALTGLREARRPPRSCVAAALAGLAVVDGPAQDTLLSGLCAQLSRVTPATARLALLDGLERVPELSGRPELCTRLRRLVPSPVRAEARYADIPAQDRVLLAVRDAELDRVVGHPERAIATLEHAWAALGANPCGSVCGPDPSRSALGSHPSRTTLHALVATAARVHARGLLTELVQCELAVVAPDDDSAPVRDGAALVRAAEALPDAALRDRVLELAQAALEDRCEQAGAWPARLLELRADSAAGDEDACALLRRADGLNESLGRKRTASVSEHELRVTVQLRGDRLAASVLDHEGARRELHAPRVPPLGHLLTDPSGLAGEIATFLRPLAPDDGPLDLGLRMTDATLRALPWELAAPELDAAGLRLFRRAPRARGEAADLRAVQGALARQGFLDLAPDGDLGPRTRAALAAFQRECGLPATGEPDPGSTQRLHTAVAGRARVVIVRPSHRAEQRSYRGSRHSGVPVDWIYERAGYEAVVLDSPPASRLAGALAEHPAAILHLNVGLVDHHGAPALDLLGGVVGRVTGTAFDALLPRHAPAPLVVVDAPAPPSRGEALTQLRLRNGFAAELTAVGTARAVLATGLARYRRQQRLYDTLVGAFARGEDVGTVAAAVRDRAGDGVEDALAFTACALFARTPHERFPAP